jgi:lipopolysaccharide/colanic/teichoic acid biosynthesis glycosyltransferase
MYQHFFKRVFGFILALIALPFVLIVAIPVAIIIKIEDGGPIFFRGKRIGKNLKEFRMYKFRSMKVNAPDIRNEDGSTFNSENDPRLTKVGKFIRKTSIDELPQILNVLLGDMAWIGPRPSPLGNIDKYPGYYEKKCKVLPGITGYTQAKLRNAATLEERMENDIYYAEHISFLFDVKIIFMTINTVLFRKGIYHNK